MKNTENTLQNKFDPIYDPNKKSVIGEVEEMVIEYQEIQQEKIEYIMDNHIDQYNKMLIYLIEESSDSIIHLNYINAKVGNNLIGNIEKGEILPVEMFYENFAVPSNIERKFIPELSNLLDEQKELLGEIYKQSKNFENSTNYNSFKYLRDTNKGMLDTNVLDDMKQDLLITVIKSVHLYDEDNNIKFNTYVVKKFQDYIYEKTKQYYKQNENITENSEIDDRDDDFTDNNSSNIFSQDDSHYENISKYGFNRVYNNQDLIDIFDGKNLNNLFNGTVENNNKETTRLMCFKASLQGKEIVSAVTDRFFDTLYVLERDSKDVIPMLEVIKASLYLNSNITLREYETVAKDSEALEVVEAYKYIRNEMINIDSATSAILIKQSKPIKDGEKFIKDNIQVEIDSTIDITTLSDKYKEVLKDMTRSYLKTEFLPEFNKNIIKCRKETIQKNNVKIKEYYKTHSKEEIDTSALIDDLLGSNKPNVKKLSAQRQ